MAFWSDIDEEYVSRYRDWHSTEHIPERVGIRGFLTGQRYERIHAVRRFFMFYDTQNVGVLSGPDYVDALNSPTPWTREALTHFRNPLRNVYEEMGESNKAPADASPFVTSIRFNLAADAGRPSVAMIEDADDGYRARQSRLRLFEVDETGTGMKTSERAIYGTQKRAPAYLFLLDSEAELESIRVERLERHLASVGLEDIELEQYRLEFGMRSSSPR